MVEHHVALQGRIGHGAVRRVRVLPRPFAGMLFALGDLSVYFPAVDERNVAVIRFALLLQKVKDTGGARHGHRNGVDLLARLVHLPGELLAHAEVRGHHRHGERGEENAG